MLGQEGGSQDLQRRRQRKGHYFLGLGREGLKTGGAWKYYLSDGLGSTALLTDDSGNTVAAYDYEDYGSTTQIAGSAGVYNPYRYTGQEWDAELGMYNLRARHYSPSLGRFLARDPIGNAGGTNLMAYCHGDPVDFVDPDGLAPFAGDLVVYSSSYGGLRQAYRSGLTATTNPVLGESTPT